MKQAHAAYEELTDYVNKAMSTHALKFYGHAIQDVQDRAIDFAKANAESAFTFASEVCNTQTPQELFAFEKQFAQDRLHAFVTHTQELYSLIGENLRKP
jgi:hypothetical protein